MFTGKSLFENENKENNLNKISFEEADVVFISDFFTNEYVGGAELSTEALFETSPYKTFKLKCNELTKERIEKGVNKTWVFFNFAEMNLNLVPYIVANLYYFITEYDYKFCKYRSTELHKYKEGKDCNCHNENYGKYISSFFAGSEKNFWMSDKQKERYQQRFPFLTNEKSIRLSSIFNVKDLDYIESLSKARKENGTNGKWAIIGSNSWIKGIEQSKKALCEFLEKEDNYDVIADLSYSDLLRTLSEYEGLCFMPLGGDTCPRIVIEAKLLGLELYINDNSQHVSEEWWGGERDEIESYLLAGHNRFWDEIKRHLNREIKLSGYTTATNVINGGYPWKQSIQSLLDFCDEVIVIDGGSTDGTWEELNKYAKNKSKIKIYQHAQNWHHKRFAVFDGNLKAIARDYCTGNWCWQQDIDEIVHEKDYNKIKNLSRQLPKSVHLIALPVVEYWGSDKKVRLDINPWKWRLSRNYDYITHGIPADLRKTDSDGNLYASIGTDGCDYIRKENNQYVQCTHFYTKEAHKVRMLALNGDEKACHAYNKWFEKVINELPGVFHYSWFDLERKIKTYKNYWTRHWQSLYDIKQADTPENNMFFNKSWASVTEKEIKNLSIRLKGEMGGWVFHEKINFNKPTPFLKISKKQPKIMTSPAGAPISTGYETSET
jgi:glycosyltransferase involved in cell wall biosynthesis